MKIRELLLCGAIDPIDPTQDMETPNSLSSAVGPTDVVEPMPRGTSPVSLNPAMTPKQRRMQTAQANGMMTSINSSGAMEMMQMQQEIQQLQALQKQQQMPQQPDDQQPQGAAQAPQDDMDKGK